MASVGGVRAQELVERLAVDADAAVCPESDCA
jgi:hypothetical protein